MGFVKLLKKGARMLGTDIYSAGINGVNSLIGGYINEYFADRARKKNFEYNEKAATAADARQRKQYADLYSPQAMLQQYAAAGLSPSMMMSGGQSAVGGTPQGNMSAGLSGAYPSAGTMNSSITAGLQGELMKAQIRNLDENTISIQLENEIKDLNNSTLKNKWKLLNITTGGDENGIISISDHANDAKDFDDFKTKAEKLWNLEPEMNMYLHSEEGQKELRALYEANKTFNNEIAVLANSQENAELALAITRLLNTPDFINNSAAAQKQELEKVIEDSKLTGREREAFNNLLDKMGESTWTDIAIVLLTFIANNTSANLNMSTSRSHSIISKK